MTVFQTILAVFVAAHATGDFILQTGRDVEYKGRLAVLLKHGAVHVLLVFAFAGTWNVWLPALAIGLAHVLIDLGKQRLSAEGWKAFLADQAAHLAVLLAAAVLAAELDLLEASLWSAVVGPFYFRVLAVVAGLVVTVAAGAYFVDLAVEPFLAQIRAGRPRASDAVPTHPFETTERTASERLRGLRDGGRTIGQLERSLIFIFVLIDQFGAIGFLIAAKSIFRFGELRERANRMEAEYIIIGTLISFLWAIVAALLTRLLGGF